MARRTSPRALAGLLLCVAVAFGAMRLWEGRQAQSDAQRLAAVARPGDIRLLSSLTCVYCLQARRWMSEHGIPFDECFIERDAACAREYEARGAPGTPVVLVRGQPQLGFSAPRVARQLGG